MTLCAGTCTYKGRAGGCRIALSEPLLKLRPASDLRSTLLHEMIHAHLFNRGISRDGPDGHGPLFMSIADRINAVERPPVHITPYHTFSEEVDHYRTHHWRCEKCSKLIKRAMNRPPAPRDPFWPGHLLRCGGTFRKIAEPPKKVSTSSKQKSTGALGALGISSSTQPSRIPGGVVRTMRIDQMLSKRSKPNKVECPVCTQLVSENSLTRHLDQCLSADFDDVEEVPVSNPSVKPTTNPTPSSSTSNPVETAAKPQLVPESPPIVDRPRKRARNFPLPEIIDVDSPPSPPPSSSLIIATASTRRHDTAGKTNILESRVCNSHAATLITPSHVPVGDRLRAHADAFVNLAFHPNPSTAQLVRPVLDEVQTPVTRSRPERAEFAELLRPVLNDLSPLEKEAIARRGIMGNATMMHFQRRSIAETARALGVQRGGFEKDIRSRATVKDGWLALTREDADLLFGGGADLPVRKETASGVGVRTGGGQPRAQPSKASGGNATTNIGQPLPGSLHNGGHSGGIGAPSSAPTTDDHGASGRHAKNVARKPAEVPEMGNCPLCDLAIAKSELQAHVNRCLDHDDELTRELVSSQTLDNPEMANCPICDVSIARPQLEAHVNDCLASSGLSDALLSQ